MADQIDWNEKFYNKDYTKKYPQMTLAMAKSVGDKIGVDWEIVDLGEFLQGMCEEFEHMGILGGQKTKVIGEGDVTSAAMIAYEHILEVPDYYTRLEQLEHDGEDAHPDDAAVKAWVAKKREQYQEKWDAASKEAEGITVPESIFE